MSTADDGTVPHGPGESERQSDEGLLNEAVAETRSAAVGQDEDEIETALRASMSRRGLAPDDTAPLAKIIVDSASATSSVGWHLRPDGDSAGSARETQAQSGTRRR